MEILQSGSGWENVYLNFLEPPERMVFMDMENEIWANIIWNAVEKMAIDYSSTRNEKMFRRTARLHLPTFMSCMAPKHVQAISNVFTNIRYLTINAKATASSMDKLCLNHLKQICIYGKCRQAPLTGFDPQLLPLLDSVRLDTSNSLQSLLTLFAHTGARIFHLELHTYTATSCIKETFPNLHTLSLHEISSKTDELGLRCQIILPVIAVFIHCPKRELGFKVPLKLLPGETKVQKLRIVDNGHEHSWDVHEDKFASFFLGCELFFIASADIRPEEYKNIEEAAKRTGRTVHFISTP